MIYNEINLHKLAKKGEMTYGIINSIDYVYRSSGNQVYYRYYFYIGGKRYEKNIAFNYDAIDLEHFRGDSVYVMYLQNNPKINRDYRFLVEENYGVDTNKFNKVLKNIIFQEQNYPIEKSRRKYIQYNSIKEFFNDVF